MKATHSEHQSIAVIGQQAVGQIVRPQMILTNDEFDNLKRSIQLLRIEQIRYIVQKFALPANGNKTRLIQLIIGIIDTLRPTPLLVEMSIEVNRLLAQQHEPFANPLETTYKLLPFQGNETFITPENPFIVTADSPPIFGPLFAPHGNSVMPLMPIDFGRTKSAIIEFSFKSLPPSPFDMCVEINGIRITISSDDPNPQPIDISDFCGQGNQVYLAISYLKTNAPMLITVRDYELQTVHSIASKMAAKANVSAKPEMLRAKGKLCAHTECFLLIKFLSQFYSSCSSLCPICAQPIDLSDCIISAEKGEGEN